MRNEFINCLQYLLLGYEPHAGVICQFLWREIEACAGNGRACRAALPGCEHDMPLVNAPGAKMRGSVGPNNCTVGVSCATARWSGPLSTLRTSSALPSSAANWPTVASVTSTAGDCMSLAISSNMGCSFLLPVRIIRTGAEVVNDSVRVSAHVAHPRVRQSLTPAPVPGWITTIQVPAPMPSWARRSVTHWYSAGVGMNWRG